MSGLLLLILFLNFALSIGLSYLLYPKVLKDKNQSILFVLRFLSFFLIGILLINPEIDRTTYEIEKPKLFIAVDNSESINELANTDQIRQFLDESESDKDLNTKYDINYLKFDQDVSILDSLSFSAQSSNIATSIDFWNNQNEDNAAFVLLTDGNQTFGEDFSYKQIQNKNNFYNLVAGDTTTYKDFKIDLVNINAYAFLNNKFPVEVFTSYTGKTETIKSVKIISNNRVLAEKSITLKPESSSKINFLLNANSLGPKTYSIELEALSGEKNIQNNTQNISIEVIDSRSKVLMLADILHPDLGTIQKSISNNKQIQVDLKKSSDNIDLSNYNLVIFYQPQAVSKEIFELVQKQNLNYFLIGGTKTDYDFLNRMNLGFKKQITNSTEDYFGELNPDFSPFQVQNLNFEDFPPLVDIFGETYISKSHQVLLEKNVNGVEVESPLWLFMQDSDQKSAFLFGENLWKWRSKSYLLNSDFQEFDDFILKTIQYLSQDFKQERLVVEAKSFYKTGEINTIEAEFFDENFKIDPRAEINLELKNIDTEEIIENQLVFNNQSYISQLNNLSPGSYEYKVSVKGESLTKSSKFEVLEFSPELQFVNAYYEKLSKITNSGQNFLLSNYKNLIQTLNSNSLKQKQKSIKKTESLIDFEWLIILLALTLGIEWFYRKYKGLI
ncbi:hypothetical protein [Psychroflexus aestuariivivens]|uniref:hypothetical protein n=1 Tax=Psychroflexus aestuariivivens TaxID=1795040 RepID=UPI000FDC5DD6|nr:hypothetical protein [Psychroflexus aestuariivivens]